MSTVVETIDCTPTWEAATRIYIAVLRNPDAGLEAQAAAEEDLLALAKAMDGIKASREAQS